MAQSKPVAAQRARNFEVLTRPVWVAALYTVLLRTVYAVYGALLAERLSLDSRLIHSNRFTDHLMQRSEGWRYALLGVWERFDTLWYLHIAQYGYDRPEGTVFYPLYPLLVRVISWLIHPPLLAALVISTIACFFYFWGIQSLVELDSSRKTAIMSVYFAGLWPAGFMLFAGYAESMVGACSVWAIYFARVGRWPLAGILGLLAGATKAVGGLVAVPLAYLALRNRPARAWISALPLLPAIAFTVWVRLAGFGSVSDAYTRFWRTSVEFPWMTLVQSLRRVFTGGSDLLFLLNFISVVAVCCLVLLMPARTEYKLYTVAVLVLFMSKKTDPLLQSTMRYLVVVFPAFTALALLLRNRAAGLIVLSVFFLLLNGILLYGFFEWGLVV